MSVTQQETRSPGGNSNSLFVVSWSVAGIAEKDTNSFFDHVYDTHLWCILFLQETFRRTEGLAPEVGTNSDSDGHLIHMTSKLLGGLIAMWAPLIFSKWLPLDKKMNTSKTAIGSSLTWLAGMWHLTKAQASKLKSLAARTAVRVKGIRRTPGHLLEISSSRRT